MMTRVDFYLIANITAEACFKTACRIIDKAYQQGQHIYVLCTDNRQTQLMDKLLWTFHDTSFLPHQIYQNLTEADAPILLGDLTQRAPLENYAIMANLTSHVPENFMQFERVFEVVSADPEQRAHARERYRLYRQHGCQLHSHQIR